jgi:hypothetical protein
VKKAESRKVVDARRRRAERLAKDFTDWSCLAERSQYPRSLVEIAEQALAREYTLGRKAAKR